MVIGQSDGVVKPAYNVQPPYSPGAGKFVANIFLLSPATLALNRVIH